MRLIPFALVSAMAALAERPPAVPLVANDPYFSVWSMADKLTDDATRHWTGSLQPMTGLVRVDGKVYRIMGTEPRDAPAMTQRLLDVQPTQTTYGFEDAGVRVSLTFTTPFLPHDLDVLSRPVTYVSWSVQASDGREHDVKLYFDAGAELVVNTPDQPASWARLKTKGLEVLRMGSREQPMLAKSGDNLRIDWGYLYVAARGGGGVTSAAADRAAARADFVEHGALTVDDEFADHNPRTRYGRVRQPVMAFSFDLGRVGAARPEARNLILAYDDLYSLEYLNRRVRPYWRRKGAEAPDLLRAADGDYESLMQKSERFNRSLMADLERAGGNEYARICALAYRQSIAAHKLAVDGDGTLLFFSKENFSNGSINTVDVFYPSAPLFLLMNTKLLRGSVEPILQYAAMSRWPWPYAPHDLGTYPLANGQTYGGGEQSERNQMPVEESGNMLILLGAMAKADGLSDLAAKYWTTITKWAEFLRDKGLDPENQLCTDDFAGHLARNANLSLKAIEGLGSYAMLADLTGHKAEAQRYRAIAEDYAQKWMKLGADGDHYVLAFGNPGTWSQKYNLVWDRILGLNLFPLDVARKEVGYYKSKQNIFGLPLDNRAAYTKLDWLVWTATLAENPADFQSMIAPAYKWVNETPTRVPLSDWYMTTDGKQRGFQARSVVGGVFIKMLADPAMWAKWRQ